jgi:tetratricopeptide (TPR) repeat protein
VLLVCLPVIVATTLVQGTAVTARAAGADAVPSSTASRWLTWRNSIVGGSLAFVLLGIAVTGYTGMRATGIGPWGTLMAKGVLEERDLIVLADFEDHTSDSLARALTELVRVDLEQSPAVKVANDEYVSQVLERMEKDPGTLLTSDLAREVAIREGLKAVVTGEVHRVGSSYVLSLGLVAAETGETLASLRETASDLDATIPAIERMTRNLRERIGESLKTVRASPPLRRVRTASLEALRLFTEAGQALSRSEYELALDRLNEAIEMDTLFAAAYRNRASAVHGLQMQRAQRISDATRAYELRHRLPPGERYWVEAGFHMNVTGDIEKVVSAYRALLELEPDNTGRLGNLAWTYFLLRDYARAEEMYRRQFELDSLAFDSWGSLARSLFNQGKFDDAWETLRQYEQRHPEHQRIPLYRARFASAQGDYDAAEAYLRHYGELQRESLIRRQAVNQHLGKLAKVQGRLAEAEELFRRAMALSEEADQTMRYFEAGFQLASLRLWFLGDTTRALETVAEVLERYPFDSLEPADRPYPMLSFYAFAGAPERARELLAEWGTVLPPDRFGNWWERYRHSARGAVALVEGKAEEAMAEFRWWQERTGCPVCAFPLLGRAHELAGQPDSALAMYERYLITPWDRRTLSGDLPDHGRDPYWLPVVYERLGDLYEQRGDTAKAILYYGKLVDLWKDADPELQPRVEAARRAIEALSPDT